MALCIGVLGWTAMARAQATLPTPGAVLAELNLARTQPSQYAEFLEARRACYGPDTLAVPGQPLIRFVEGPPALEEAIRALLRQSPVGPLTVSPGLARAAADHARQMGQAGQTGHLGTDTSTPEERFLRYGHMDLGGSYGEAIDYVWTDPRCMIIDLIVDDGVPSRGHRVVIYNPVFTQVGIAVAAHKTQGCSCVIDLANRYVERARPPL
jgi:hypothetical protein